ncbi:MAG: ammonium transporter [Candidatus Competibacterales bacterium]
MESAAVQLAYALDTFYFLVMGAFVMYMAAGFAMLEAGMVRAKNTTEILLKNVSLFAVACIMYMLVGYLLMYPGDNVINAFLPQFNFLLDGADNDLQTVVDSDGDVYYSNLSDFFFQVVFVATAMSIISGAVAERMRLWSFLTFAVFFTGFIYPIQGYWNWGGGLLTGDDFGIGYVDFAGSGTVHLCGAVGALAGVLLLGPRAGKYGKNGEINPMPGANLPLATLGTFILWFGWFGFNGGSELKVSNVEEANAVARVFVNTNIAACGGILAALITARLLFGKSDLTMALNGCLAGLVAITAQPLDPTPGWATIVGAIGGVIVVLSIVTLDKLRIDDPVGAISVHGTAGIWGVMIVPVSTESATYMGQLIGLGAIFGFTFVASLIIWGIIKLIVGLRISQEEEYEGIDLAECGMEAYPEFVSPKA